MALAYLTEIFRPEGAALDDVTALLAPPLGRDAVTLRYAMAKEPPSIVGRFEVDRVRAAVEVLRRAGGDGMVTTLDDLAALGGTRKIRDLRMTDSGDFAVELWRGGTARIEPRRIDVVVRGSLSETYTGSPPAASGWAAVGTALGAAASSPAGYGFGYGGAYGWAARRHARESAEHRAAMDRRVTTSHKLDLHVPDVNGAPSVLQIDGDKFGFGVLGALRGHSDLVNIDRMCELVAHLAPEVVVDPYFSLWSPPVGHDRLRLPLMAINRDDPAFAFYSRWAALMYRRIGR